MGLRKRDAGCVHVRTRIESFLGRASCERLPAKPRAGQIRPDRIDPRARARRIARKTGRSFVETRAARNLKTGALMMTLFRTCS
ncbi:hypothetical protein, partial [Escherichia coli]|uniref:hypothetical protein n=1 Tax=Escherichia coli TaxID=562 RepID=UPI001BE4AFD0